MSLHLILHRIYQVEHNALEFEQNASSTFNQIAKTQNKAVVAVFEFCLFVVVLELQFCFDKFLKASVVSQAFTLTYKRETFHIWLINTLVVFMFGFMPVKNLYIYRIYKFKLVYFLLVVLFVFRPIMQTYVEGFHQRKSVEGMQYNQLGNTDLIVSKLSLGNFIF